MFGDLVRSMRLRLRGGTEENRPVKWTRRTVADAIAEYRISAIIRTNDGSLAAGAMEAAACLLSIRDGIIPPTANFEEPDPGCDIDCVPNRARAVLVRSALSLSAGFGGQNAAIVLVGC